MPRLWDSRRRSWGADPKILQACDLIGLRCSGGWPGGRGSVRSVHLMDVLKECRHQCALGSSWDVFPDSKAQMASELINSQAACGY